MDLDKVKVIVILRLKSAIARKRLTKGQHVACILMIWNQVSDKSALEKERIAGK